MAREYDSPWKLVLAVYFERFINFFYPGLHAMIDWSEPPVSLDQELQAVLREAEFGERRVDNLTRVRLNSGEETWIYIHVEVQNQHDARLAERIFLCHVRLFDLYGQHPINLVILGDESTTWRPDEYTREVLGRTICLPFFTTKLIDLAGRLNELESKSNPIGLIVASHLGSVLTGDLPESRLEAKLRLVRRLLERGIMPEEVRQLYRMIDWFLELPDELTNRFRDGLEAIEQEKQVTHLTSTERLYLKEGKEIGLIEGRQEGRQEGQEIGLREGLELALVAKFSVAGQAIADEFLGRLRLEGLRRLKVGLSGAKSVEQVRELLTEPGHG